MAVFPVNRLSPGPKAPACLVAAIPFDTRGRSHCLGDAACRPLPIRHYWSTFSRASFGPGKGERQIQTRSHTVIKWNYGPVFLNHSFAAGLSAAAAGVGVCQTSGRDQLRLSPPLLLCLLYLRYIGRTRQRARASHCLRWFAVHIKNRWQELETVPMCWQLMG